MLKGKSADYELFWIENDKNLGQGISWTKKWTDKVIDISRFIDRMTVMKYWLKMLLFQSSEFIHNSVVYVIVEKIISTIVLLVQLEGLRKRTLLTY